MIKGERKYITRNEQLIHATMLMNFKSIMLHEISQTQKIIHCVHSLIGNSKKDIIIDTEKRLVIAREWRED